MTERRSPFSRFWALRSGRIGLILAVVLAAIILSGPYFVPYKPNEIDLNSKLSAPGYGHWLGTDNFGRDQLARILDGGRRSLGAALVVMGSILFIALCVGTVAGMVGGIVDALMMRIIDILLALPSLIVALAIIASSWAYYARLTRSYVINARKRYDVIADRLAGVGWPRLVMGHILPGVFAQLLIIATLRLGGIIIGIAGLSFLGLGVQPPLAEWGAMLSSSRLYFVRMPWLLIAPSVAIFLSVAAANLIGNALRDAGTPGGRR